MRSTAGELQLPNACKNHSQSLNIVFIDTLSARRQGSADKATAKHALSKVLVKLSAIGGAGHQHTELAKQQIILPLAALISASATAVILTLPVTC
jgi:hypothetical protein